MDIIVFKNMEVSKPEEMLTISKILAPGSKSDKTTKI